MKYIANVTHGYGSSTQHKTLGEYSTREEACEALFNWADDRGDIVDGESENEIMEVLKERGFYFCGWSSSELEVCEVE